MTIGHRLEQDEILETSIAELYKALGERDTADLFDEFFRRHQIITSHGISTGAGISLDRRRIYIDSVLHQQVMDNEFKASGLEPQQIILAWLQHEATEKCIIDGDNPVDTYLPAHHRALRREHELVEFFGSAPEQYETAIWPALLKCYERPVRNPPPDLWCGPILDNPDDRDEEIIAQLQKAGVTDALRHSKYSAHYGIGPYRCCDCRNWMGARDKTLTRCRVVSGLVRAGRHCDYFIDVDDSIREAAREDDVQKFAHDVVSFGPARGDEACRACKYSDHADKPRCALVEDIKPNGWCRLWVGMT